MIDRKFIGDKLEKIKLYSKEIEVIFDFSLDEIKKDFMKYRTLERETQLIADGDGGYK